MATEKVEEAVQAILAELVKAAEKGVTEEELAVEFREAAEAQRLRDEDEPRRRAEENRGYHEALNIYVDV